VALAQASTRFPLGLLYNVDHVQLRRQTGPFTTELLAQRADDTQTEFSFGSARTRRLLAGQVAAARCDPGQNNLARLPARARTGELVSPTGLQRQPGLHPT
jgi:hypothetical protein